MAQHELLVKLGLQSDSFTRNLKNVNNQLKLTESEFKKLQSETNNFGKSQKDLTSKLNSLKEKKEQLTAKTILYSNKIKELNNNILDETKKHEGLSVKLEKEKSKLDELKATHGKTSNAYKKQAEVVKNTQVQYDKSQKKIENFNLALQKHKISLTETETEINKLNNAIEKTKFDKMVLPISNASEKLSTLSSSLDAAAQKVGNVGSALTAGITVPIAGVGATVVKFGSEFQAAMSKVGALSGTTGNELKQLEAKAREMGKATSFTAIDAANGLNYMALAGWNTNQMLKGIEPVLRLAEAGEEDLATTSDLVTDSMSSLGLKVDDLSEYLDKVAKGAVISNADVGQMLRTYNQVGGTFKRLNVPLSDSSALIGVLANRGLKAEQAGRALSSTLINLTSGSGTAGKAMKELGLSAYDGKGKFKGVEKVLLELHAELNKTENGTRKYTDAQKDMYLSMIGGKTQIRTLDALMNGVAETTENGKTEFQNLKEEIENSEGALMQMATTMKDNVKGDWEKFTSMLGELALTIMDVLEPALREILQKATSFIEKLIEMDDSTKRFIVKAALMAASIGPILLAFSGLLKVFSFATGGLATLGRSFIKIGSITSKVFKSIKGGSSVFKALSGAIAGFPAVIGLAVAAFVGLASILGENENALAMLQEKWGFLGTAIGGVCEIIAGTVQMTIGNVIIGLGTLGKVIGKLVTFQWNEIGNVIKEGGSKIAQNSAKAYDNMGMQSTQAIQKMRSMTKEEVSGLVDDMEFILEKLPRVSFDAADGMAEQFAQSLSHLDETSISILSSTSDTMNMLFRGIREGMSNEEAVAQYTKNLESLSITGGVEADKLRMEIEKTLGLINNNMADSGDRFSREAKTAMEQFNLVTTQGIDAAASNVSTHLAGLDTNILTQLKGMGNNWSFVFKDIALDGSMTTAEMARNIESNIRNMAETNPRFVEMLRDEMKTYFDKLPDDAKDSMLELSDEVEKGTNSAVNSSEGKGKKIEENLKFESKENTSNELAGVKGAIESNSGPIADAAKGVGKGATEGYKEALGVLDQTTMEKMLDQAKNMKTGGEQSKAAMQENAVSSIDGFISTWDANSGRINASVDSTFKNINRLTTLRWGNTTHGLSEVNKWLTTVSNKAASTKASLTPLTSLRWGNTTRGLSEINKWLSRVASAGNRTKASLTPLTSLRWGNTTKGLSEVNKWLKTVTNAGKTTKNSLAGILKVTYGSVTKGLSEVNKWLKNIRTSAGSAKSYLQGVAGVRFGGLTKSLSEVNRWLGIVSSKAHTTRSAVASVSAARPKMVTAPVSLNKMDILSKQNLVKYDMSRTDLNRDNAIQRGIANNLVQVKKPNNEFNIEGRENDSILMKTLIKQNEMLMKLLLEEKEITIHNYLAVDGKNIAKSSAKYMVNEMNKMENRKNRLAGV